MTTTARRCCRSRSCGRSSPGACDVVVAHLRARPPWGIRRLSEASLKTTPVYTVPPQRWLAGSGLKQIAREHPFELVHAQHYGGATRASFACRRYRWPMVYEIHSLLGDEVERDRLGRGLVFRTYQAIERKVFRHAAAVIALGEPVKTGRRRKRKACPKTGCSVIYPGIDLAEYEEPGEPARRCRGSGAEHKVIMYVGSIVHPNQGVPILIDALPRVFAAVPESRCVLVGGPAEAAAEYRARLGSDASKLIVLAGQTSVAGRCAFAPRRRAGSSPAGVPGELLGAEQDRRLSGRGPADRGDRFRRLPAASGGRRARGFWRRSRPSRWPMRSSRC